jgi:hypothetical protein
MVLNIFSTSSVYLVICFAYSLVDSCPCFVALVAVLVLVGLS